MDRITDIWISCLQFLFEYNGAFLIFSALGFLLSLFWYSLSERQRRVKALLQEKITDEKAFFGQFEDIENPLMKIPDFSLENGPKNQGQQDENLSRRKTDFQKPFRKEAKASYLSPVTEQDPPSKEGPPEQNKESRKENQQVESEVKDKSQEQALQAQEIFDYDEDEKKVRDLLEQIKKDMHEQGGQTP